MNVAIFLLVRIFAGFIQPRNGMVDDYSYGNGLYLNTIYPGLQISNGATESVWNESNLWPEWGIYVENTRYHLRTWSFNLTSTELGNLYPPWIIMGWIETSSQYNKHYYIRLKNQNDSQTYSLTINFTIIVGCSWASDTHDNIQVMLCLV